MISIRNNFIPIILFCAGIFFCYRGTDGWGWFLFVGVLLYATPFIERIKEDEKDEEIDEAEYWEIEEDEEN